MTKIEWTPNAKMQLGEILAFYVCRNGSSASSKRLKKEIWRSLKIIRGNQCFGELVPGYDNRRRITIGNFVLAYELDEDVVHIHSIRDGRRNEE